MAIAATAFTNGRQHGTRAGYQAGCRCGSCATDGRADAAAYMRAYRAGATGTRAAQVNWQRGRSARRVPTLFDALGDDD